MYIYIYDFYVICNENEMNIIRNIIYNIISYNVYRCIIFYTNIYNIHFICIYIISIIQNVIQTCSNAAIVFICCISFIDEEIVVVFSNFS